jgi:hypothetical protein
MCGQAKRAVVNTTTGTAKQYSSSVPGSTRGPIVRRIEGSKIRRLTSRSTRFTLDQYALAFEPPTMAAQSAIAANTDQAAKSATIMILIYK